MDTQDSMLSFLDNYGSQEANIQNSLANKEQSDRINTSLGFYEQSYNPTTAVEIRNQQHNASRAGKLASMIVEYGRNNGVNVTGNDAEIINQYISNLPEQLRGKVAQRFSDYTHSTEYIEDSKDFALEMGWREKGVADYIVEGAKGAWNMITYGPMKLGRGIRKLEDMGNAAISGKNNQESLDVMNLANERYGFWALLDGYLSDEDRADLQFEVDNNAASLERQHNMANAAMDIAIGGLMTGIELTGLGAGITAGIGAASELPITSDMLERVGEKATDLGGFVNQAPVLKQYREALADEESRLEFDSFVGNMIIGAAINTGIRGGKWGFKKLSGRNTKSTTSGGGTVPPTEGEVTMPTEGGVVPLTKEQATALGYEIKNFASKTSPEKIIGEFEKTKKRGLLNKLFPSAGEKLGKMNKMSTKAAIEFEEKYGVKHGDYLNRKGIVGGEEKTAKSLVENINNNYESINEAVKNIEGDFEIKSIAYDNLIMDVIKYANNTLETVARPDVYNNLMRIAEKYFTTGKLSQDEALGVLRYFEKNNKMAYKQSNVPEDIKKATNIDSAARRQLAVAAEEAGFPNMAEISKDISMSRAILDELGKDIMRESMKDLNFSDYALLFDINQLPVNLLRTFLKSDLSNKLYVKLANKVTGFKPDEPLKVDMSKIDKANASRKIQQKFDEYKGDGTPKLNYEGPEEATDNPNFVEMRAKDKPNPKDLVIETYAKDPYNVPKVVKEREPVKVLEELDPKKAIQKNIRDISAEDWKLMEKEASKAEKQPKKTKNKKSGKSKKKK